MWAHIANFAGWDKLTSAVSALAALVGLVYVWLSRREQAIRRGEVLGWANAAIDALGELSFVVSQDGVENPASPETLHRLALRTLVLADQGRMFFRNAVGNAHGIGKESAYRGYRPKILDQLIVAHKIARQWGSADDNVRSRMEIAVEDCLKRFVSLAQKEVGRSRVASRAASVHGDGSSLAAILDSVSPKQLAAVTTVPLSTRIRKNGPPG